MAFVNQLNFCCEAHCVIREILLILFGDFAGYGPCGVMQRLGPCDELGIDGWDRAGFHGGITLMVMVVKLREDQCGYADGRQDQLCVLK